MTRQSLSRSLIAISVMATTLASSQAVPIEIRDRVLSIPQGSAVEVRLQDKTRLRGRMGSVSEQGFSMQVVKAGALVERSLTFAEVRSVKQQTGPGAGIRILAGVGVVYLILLGMTAILLAAGAVG